MKFVASFLRPNAVGLAANGKSGLQFDLKHCAGMGLIVSRPRTCGNQVSTTAP